jgi:phosphoglycolate phosphatase-like HAD superfamily hydrolase
VAKKVFVFDVDGVIVDSTLECLVIAWNAYIEYAKLEKEKIELPEQAPMEFQMHFKSIRNYVRSMDEYLVVFSSKEGEINDQKSYEEALSKLDKNALKDYGDKFFHERENYKKRGLQKWIKLHTVYKGVTGLIESIDKIFNVYVVTGKDKESVLDFFKYLNINIDANKIYDKYAAKNKLLSLEMISKKEHLSAESIFFLDDNVTHLKTPLENGYQVIMAKWGYGMKEHFEMAESLHIPILDISEVLEYVKEKSEIR